MADDRDIKIYVKKSDSEFNEFQMLSDDIQKNIENGNKDKAEALGIGMAKIEPNDYIFNMFPGKISASEIYQIRVLSTFTAEYAVQKNIENKFLSDIVSSSMYDYLKENEPGYFGNISDGSAFTFYLLALKRDGDTAMNIGEQFALRCGTKNDEMKAFGAKVFETEFDRFTDMIKDCCF